MRWILFICLTGFSLLAAAQQVGDTSYVFKNVNPKYASGKGSKVFIDEAHHNFHRVNGRYLPFAKVLRSDGYVVEANERTFTKQQLQKCKVLVIANALNAANDTSWSLPNPSAFTAKEINCVQQWVKNGGRLFLIADHMPFGGAAQELAKAFGFEWYNGFAMNKDSTGIDTFTRAEQSLLENEITNGNGTNEKVDTVITFTGSAFKIPAQAKPILQLGYEISVLMPKEAWVFIRDTPFVSSNKDMYQGAYMSYGKGKIVAFGEAAMFTAQVNNGSKFGLNAPKAKQNGQLLLNIIHWLDL